MTNKIHFETEVLIFSHSCYSLIPATECFQKIAKRLQGNKSRSRETTWKPYVEIQVRNGHNWDEGAALEINEFRKKKKLIELALDALDLKVKEEEPET